MGGKKWPCEWSSTILEVLMEDCYFLRTSTLNWVHLRRNIRNVFVSFGSFITKSWLSRVKVKARKYNNGGSVVPHVLFSSALPFSLATDSGDQASVLQSQNALLRLSKDVSSGLHRSTQRSTQENWWSFAKIKTKQNKKYFGRILWKYIKLQVDNRHDLFLKQNGWWPSLPACPSLPPSISNIELRRTKKMFGCFSLWKKKNGTKQWDKIDRWWQQKQQRSSGV